jgi:HK97 family phage portal protein
MKIRQRLALIRAAIFGHGEGRGRFFRRAGPYPPARDVWLDEHTFLSLSTAWRCVQVISGALATSEKKVFERLERGDHDERPDDPLWYILNRRPNPDTTAVGFWRAINRHRLTFGNGYAEIVRDAGGRVAQLWNISPDRVTLERDTETGLLRYVVQVDGGPPRVLSGAHVLHLRGPGFCSYAGDSPLGTMMNALALSASAEQFASNFFAKGTSLSGFLRPTGDIDDESREEIRREWDRLHSGSGNAFRTAILEGVEWVDVDRPSLSDAQALDARRFQVEEICRFFGVPPTMVGHLDRATWSNIEHLYTDFSRSTLREHAHDIEQEVEAKLFPNRKPWRFVILDLGWAQQGDFKTRAEAYRVLSETGAYTINDILRAEGRNTIGPEGDVRLINSAKKTLEQIIAPPAPPSPPAPPGAPPPGAESDEGEDDAEERAREAAGALLRFWAERFEARASAERRAREAKRPGSGALDDPSYHDWVFRRVAEAVDSEPARVAGRVLGAPESALARVLWQIAGGETAARAVDGIGAAD